MIDFKGPDLVGDMARTMGERINHTIDRECIAFLKLNHLFEDGDTAEQAVVRLKKQGIEMHVDFEDSSYTLRNGVYKHVKTIKFKLLKVIQTHGFIIKSEIDTTP
jgi:hypothetical protein